MRAERRRQQETTAAKLKARLPSHLQSAADHASEKGSSSWVTALPIDDHSFTLHKGAFRDALCLQYNWILPHLPTSCVCGAGLTVEHALTCPTGSGYTFIRHNEIRDNLAKLLTEVCHDVCIEPHLQPLSSESFTACSVITGDSARLDVAASGFWGGRFERTFFDVRVFNPHVPSNRSPQLATTYRRDEREKRLHYEQRVLEVEHASFVPFVISCTGGAGSCATVILKRLRCLAGREAQLLLQQCDGSSALPSQLCSSTSLCDVPSWLQIVISTRRPFRHGSSRPRSDRSRCPPVIGTHLPCQPHQPLTLLSFIFPFLAFCFFALFYCIILLHYSKIKKL